MFEGTGLNYRETDVILSEIWSKFRLNVGNNLPQAMLGVGVGAYSDSEHVATLREGLVKELDAIAILGIILCCKQLGDADGEYSYTTESYNYCCTRAELAAYYRNLGWYYLEKYKPEVSAACYLYSKYFGESQQADAELEFLEKAVGKKVAKKDLSQIQKILKDNQIPTEANPVTLALLYKAAEEAAEGGDKDQALDCYRMVYDLTADKEIGKRIESLESR